MTARADPGSPTPEAGPSSRWTRFDELFGRDVDLRSRALLRMLVGVVAVLHLGPITTDALGGDTYHDRFHRPYVDAFPDLSPGGYTAVLVVGMVAAVTMSIGLATRWSTGATFAVAAYHLLLSTTHVHNNRAYLVAILAILTLTPSGNVWSVDAWLRRRRGLPPASEVAPAWTLWLLRFECATVYGASGVSKLIDPDWFGGTVTWGRVVAEEAMVRSSILPDLVGDLLLDRSFHTVAAKLIIATELFIALGLWWRRTRPWAVASAALFHVMIHLSAEVQVFSAIGLAVLVVWADPALASLSNGRVRRRAADGALSRVTA